MWMTSDRENRLTKEVRKVIVIPVHIVKGRLGSLHFVSLSVTCRHDGRLCSSISDDKRDKLTSWNAHVHLRALMIVSLFSSLCGWRCDEQEKLPVQ